MNRTTYRWCPFGPDHIYVQHVDARGHVYSEFIVHRQVFARYTPRQLAKLAAAAPSWR